MPQENVTFQPLFDQALAAQQQKNSDESLKLYKQLLDEGRNQISKDQAATVYHNMAIQFFEKNDHFWAYTYAKKALELNPHNKLFKQLQSETAKKFEIPRVPSQINFDMKLEKSLQVLPTEIWGLLSLLSLLLFFKLFFKFILTMRKNAVENLNLKNPSWKWILGFVTALFLTWATIQNDQFDQRVYGVLTAEKTPIQTAAGPDKTVIFEAPQGLTVQILKKENDYIQVKYPGGFAGWVLQSQIEALAWPGL